MRILVVDNYDSFVYNLVQYLGELGVACEVWRNDDPRLLEDAALADFDGVLLSPGPSGPRQAGSCMALVERAAGRLPIFGVCLGLQVIAEVFGGTVGLAPHPMHGKTSPVLHDGVGVLAGLPQPLTVTRYHSLALDPATTPDVLEVTGRTEDGVIMALRHRTLALEAVQFHPESVLTAGGHRLLANWLTMCGDAEAVARSEGLAPLMTA